MSSAVSSTNSFWYNSNGYVYGDRASKLPKSTSFVTVDDAPYDSDAVVAVAASEARSSKKVAGQDAFAQLSQKTRKSRRQMPGEDYGDGYEYGDREMNARNEDSADYSVHQFLANDDARDGPVSTGDDADAAAEVRRSRELASQDHFNSENTPAADDDFIQLKSKKQRKSSTGSSTNSLWYNSNGYVYGDRASKLPKPTSFWTVDDAPYDSDAVVSVAASEARSSKKVVGQKSFAQLSEKTRKSRRQMPGD